MKKTSPDMDMIEPDRNPVGGWSAILTLTAALSSTSMRHRLAIMIAILFIAAVIAAGALFSPVALQDTPSLEYSDTGYPQGRMDREKVLLLAPHVMVLQSFAWSEVRNNPSSPTRTLVPVLVIKDPGMESRLCDYAPNMMADIKLALVQAAIGNASISDEILQAAGQIATRTINAELDAVWLKTIYLLNDVNNQVLTAAESCRLISAES